MFFSICFTVTDILRVLLIIQKCNVSDENYITLEISMYVIVDIFEMISLILFAGSIFWYFKHKNTINPKCYCKNVEVYIVAFLLVMILLPLTFATPIVGYYRDEAYLNKTSTCRMDTSKKLLAIIHATVRVGVFFSMSTLCFAFAMLVSNSAGKWVKNISVLKENACMDWDTSTDGVQEFVNKKFFTLYCNYTKIGIKSKIECDALKRWFVVQYFAYLLSVLVELVHVIRLSLIQDLSADKLDVVNTVLYLLFDVLAFFIPYYMAIWLNGLHDQYYREMREQFLMTKIKKINRTSSFKFIPGNSEPNEDYEMECIAYYNTAIGKPMTKITDFDFVPVILGLFHWKTQDTPSLYC